MLINNDMKNTLSILLLSLALTAVHAEQSCEQLLLGGWRFNRGAAAGAELPNYDDSRWQRVTIPHDWAISGPFDKQHDIQVVAIAQNGESEATEKTGRSGALPWIGEGWYRTTITIPAGYQHAALIFDGAMADPRVYIDGELVGHWAYGYNTFSIDITPWLLRENGELATGEHLLAVHLRNEEESSRWYPGAGLYRPVRLVLGPEVGIKEFGVFAYTSRLDGISADATQAQTGIMTISTELRSPWTEKEQELSLRQRLCDMSGHEVARVESAVNEGYEAIQVMHITNPQLWSPEHPVLYELVTELIEKGKVIDRQVMRTGIRTIAYSQDGFMLNGKVRKFKGVCLHHDLGPLGVAFNKAAFRRQVALLKEIGCDAIRTSHNMPAPWQMEICDEMGMLVMAESYDMWVHPKCKNGYAKHFLTVDDAPNADGLPWWIRDLTNLVVVHRNHPSIVMWSIGNEIWEQTMYTGLQYSRAMQTLMHSLDPTRPCTQGLDHGRAAIHSGVFQTMDIPGFNYRVHLYGMAQPFSPKGILLGSETASTVSSRGVYKFPVKENYGDEDSDGQVTGYDVQQCIWSNLPDDDWMWQDKAPWVIGEFVWTGFDYLGEPTPYDNYWPSRSSYFGIYDLAGLPKDRAYLYRTHWLPEEPTLHVLPHWNWQGREGEQTPVFCYTSYPEAELFVNGKSYGRKRHIDMSLEDYFRYRVQVPTPWGDTTDFPDPNAPEGFNRLDRYRLRWMDVPYEAGEIKVVAYDGSGAVAAEQVIRTAGKPHHIELVADRAQLTATPMAGDKPQDTPDLCFVTVRVVDKDGNLCPDADQQLSFGVKGKSVKFNSCCNGDATSLEVFTKPTMRAFHGEVVAVIEATDVAGVGTLTVSGKGLKTASLPIEVR